MKTRSVVLILGAVAVLALAGYAAWQSSWVRSWLLPDSENTAEIDRAGTANLKNAPLPEAAAGSPQWRGPARQGVAAAGSFRTDWDKKPPQELWRVPIGGGFGSCSVVAGKLYVQDKQGQQERVVCLDAETGQQLWEYRYDPPRLGRIGYDSGPRATPTIDGNWVYTVGESGRLLAIEAMADGPHVRWSHDLITEFNAKLPEWGVAGSPLVYRDMVIVQPGGDEAAVVAFDKITGQVKWRSGSHPPSYSSPVVAAVAGQDTIFAFLGDALLAVRPSDGMITDRFKWSTLHNANIATPLVVSDDDANTYVFISAAYSSGSALVRAERSGDMVKLVKVYERRGRGYQNHHSTSVYKDRHIFGIDGQNGLNGLKCLEFNTGKEVPDWGDRSIGQASLILAGDHLILQSANGHLYLVEANPQEFHRIAKTPKILSGNNNWASPVLVEGRIYLRDEQHVVCLDVRPTTP